MILNIENTGLGPWSAEVLGEAAAAWDELLDRGGMTGWIELADSVSEEELCRIENAARRIRENSDVLIVVGIGGSYLGARAAEEAMVCNGVKLIYAGSDLSPVSVKKIMKELEDRDFSINVVSKSGSTTEPAIAFRIFRELLVKRYGDSAKERIFATTDPEKGALRQMAVKNGWETFSIPSDVGGRYSVLSPVGLLPMAACGIDIRKVLSGASKMLKMSKEGRENSAVWQYVLARNLLYRQGKKIELYAAYEPGMQYFLEWLKQLFGESEGKEGKGIFPASCIFTTDLHSLGQYIQQGERHLMETVINIKSSGCDVAVPACDDDSDGLSYLEGSSLDWVRQQAFLGTLKAHVSGGVPTVVFELESFGEEELGELFMFFELACGMSGLMLKVEPFDQPGVEEYKKNMFTLLGKPGF